MEPEAQTVTLEWSYECYHDDLIGRDAHHNPRGHVAPHYGGFLWEISPDGGTTWEAGERGASTVDEAVQRAEAALTRIGAR